ncbi:hypothetical protein FKV68_08990 [Sinorhizobium mexicanum]|uniref:Uncharacterized protein n=1 Tax=Sinorhizobium mexicanum TaxID=375549 RepID=A0A859QEM4_9HYPH|nr:hypothetical protein FKV68_08990 [Sinorhizobium mexicanum]
MLSPSEGNALSRPGQVDALKQVLPDFAAMSNLTMRFRGSFRSQGTSRLGRLIRMLSTGE